MKIKTSILTGAQLDWAVAIAVGIPAKEIYISGRGKYQRLFRYLRDEDGELDGSYMTGPDLLFCSKWEAGGPIIEREVVEVGPAAGHRPNGASWCAHMGNRPESLHFYSHGSTPLVAAMRCFVASKLGYKVDVPDELA